MSTGQTKGAPVLHDYLGHEYGAKDISLALDEFRDFVTVKPYRVSDVVEQLASGRIVGWFEGGAEFGPRALGHRSILAAPFDKAMWLHLNQRIKYREEFRPYAPIVPSEVADKYFEMGPCTDSPFMLRVVSVRPAYVEKLGAVTHIDGSARVQTVELAQTPRWHELLFAFGERTGVPVLVNTSMNVRGEPIVETPGQALNMLLSTHMDALVLGDRIVEPAPACKGRFEDLVIARAPQVELEAGTRDDASFYRLICRSRGDFSVSLPVFMFLLLSRADGKIKVAELLDEFASNSGQKEQAVALLKDLLNDRLLLQHNGTISR